MHTAIIPISAADDLTVILPEHPLEPSALLAEDDASLPFARYIGQRPASEANVYRRDEEDNEEKYEELDARVGLGTFGELSETFKPSARGLNGESHIPDQATATAPVVADHQGLLASVPRSLGVYSTAAANPQSSSVPAVIGQSAPVAGHARTAQTPQPHVQSSRPLKGVSEVLVSKHEVRLRDAVGSFQERMLMCMSVQLTMSTQEWKNYKGRMRGAAKSLTEHDDVEHVIKEIEKERLLRFPRRKNSQRRKRKEEPSDDVVVSLMRIPRSAFRTDRSITSW